MRLVVRAVMRAFHPGEAPHKDHEPDDEERRCPVDALPCGERHVGRGGQRHRENRPHLAFLDEAFAKLLSLPHRLSQDDRAAPGEDQAEAQREVAGARPLGAPARAEPIRIPRHDEADGDQQRGDRHLHCRHGGHAAVAESRGGGRSVRRHACGQAGKGQRSGGTMGGRRLNAIRFDAVKSSSVATVRRRAVSGARAGAPYARPSPQFWPNRNFAAVMISLCFFSSCSRNSVNSRPAMKVLLRALASM